MKLFTNKTNWVIAADVEDAWRVWSEKSGEEREDYEDDWTWEEVPTGDELAIWCDAGGIPCDPEEDGSELLTKTAAQWVEEHGRGFLCSTEY